MNIAIIPARGGSKRIPRKNVKDFYGRPMLAWSIKAASESGLFDRIIVSTDDNEIAEVAKQWGAEVPFARPAELSDDFTGTADVIAHAAQWLIEQKVEFDAICCLYATAPFVRFEDLQQGRQALNSGKWNYAFSAAEFPAPVFRALIRSSDGGVEMIFPEHMNTRSQDLPMAVHDAGQFYWGRRDAWLVKAPIFSKNSTPVILPRTRVQDIDTPEDWAYAEALFKFLNP